MKAMADEPPISMALRYVGRPTAPHRVRERPAARRASTARRSVPAPSARSGDSGSQWGLLALAALAALFVLLLSKRAQ
jgi:MYXO-CTERM domain-containing protein